MRGDQRADAPETSRLEWCAVHGQLDIGRGRERAGKRRDAFYLTPTPCCSWLATWARDTRRPTASLSTRISNGRIFNQSFY